MLLKDLEYDNMQGPYTYEYQQVLCTLVSDQPTEKWTLQEEWDFFSLTRFKYQENSKMSWFKRTLLVLSKVVTLAGSSNEATVAGASFLGGAAPGLNMAGLKARDFWRE